MAEEKGLLERNMAYVAEADKSRPYLVTGGTGYIAGFIILRLLKEGFKVRATVRNIEKALATLPHLKEFSERYPGRIEFVKAELDSDDGWEAAVNGCAGIFHTASPLPDEMPEHEDEFIIPAREGALRVLRLAAAANPRIKRVVLTSSVAAVSAETREKPYTEEDWSKLEGAYPYPKSKHIAEKAAWDFVQSLPADGKVELATINPSVVVGPIMCSRDTVSNLPLKRILMRQDPGTMKFYLSFVDVREVALMHILAMFVPEAGGHRFLASSSSKYYPDLAQLMNQEMGKYGYSIATMVLPSFVVRLVALCDKKLKPHMDLLDSHVEYDHTKAEKVLGVHFRSVDESLVTMAYSLIDYGIVPNKLPEEVKAKAEERKQKDLAEA